MEQIRSIASVEGRQLLRQAYQILRFEHNQNPASVLWTTWKIATTEKELSTVLPELQFTIAEPLGILRGTGVWLQEIVNRYYYPQVNAMVYFGAALLLVLIGLNRFTHLPKAFVIAGIVFEASLLLLLFLVLLFTPVESENSFAATASQKAAAEQFSEETLQFIQDLVHDIEDIAKDHANATAYLEAIQEDLRNLVNHQGKLTEILQQLTTSLQQFLPPPADLLRSIQQTTEALSLLKQEILTLQETVATLRDENIQYAVRKELEKILSNRLH